ncbi:BTB and MATH domain-containing protein 34 [Caenorhabditis elegans]|uniref:BTB and MATH domain-containing protein 34 n=1 Tax=Caenorhabditis elegans TaxID=6239 RepID=BAT34_CAEEL|nr:BTB and MATH domain-containing protein 34 [Caenorhabditis elegans]Q9XUM6.1 RecName: Full=BTB and MATH domain-containing protein 34 [Caenorhabditis elegans]CAB04892.1 BTB and MATH domain-containing protein 34 [Caenorhabditis elegans]|eukprot:NP_001293156.1 BTB and MATH domain-containing protein 34 [Caenorhabditis elegans]
MSAVNSEATTNLLAEFQKLRGETIGLHSIFSEKSTVDISNLNGNTTLKRIEDSCEELKNEIREHVQVSSDELKSIRTANSGFLNKIEESLKTSQQEAREDLKAIEKKNESLLNKSLNELKFQKEQLKYVEATLISQQKLIEHMAKELTGKSISDMVKNNEDDGTHFEFSHTFNSVATLEKGVERRSELKEGCGSLNWFMSIKRERPSRKLLVYLNLDCEKLPTNNWIIEADIQCTLNQYYFNEWVRKFERKEDAIFKCENGEYTDKLVFNFGEYEEILRTFTKNGVWNIEFDVDIIKTVGLSKKKLRCFDESAAEVSDAVMIVKDEKFHVSKMFLAAQSSNFKLLFKNSNNSEFTLDGINSEDFQCFLELLYGEPALTGRLLNN